MIDKLISAVELLITAVYCCLYYSFKIGQFLVYVASVVLGKSIIILKNLLDFTLLLLDSFTIFTQDILQMLQHIYGTVAYILEADGFSVSRTAWSADTLEKLISAFTLTHNFMHNCVSSLINSIVHIFIICKRLLVLFGAGVWFLVTLIPLFIVHLCTTGSYYVARLLDKVFTSIYNAVRNVYSLCENLYNFFTDVPVESVIGIVIALCLVYLLIQFYATIFLCIHQWTRNIAYKIYNKLVTRRESRRAIYRHQRILPRRRLPARSRVSSSPSSEDQNVVDERFCVICQDRIKCILVLPCRHVCMCSECNLRLQTYNNSCPICRNGIESTMKIFV